MATADCIFCKIGLGELESQMIYRDDRVFAIRDINPQAPVHLLIIPIEHVVRVSPDQEQLMGHIFVAAQEIARSEGVSSSGYRLILNQGRDAGQAIDHAHVHLLAGKRLPDMG